MLNQPSLDVECAIIGGGIAGLQAAIQLGRYERKVLVIDAEDGRSNLCRRYNNVLGYPDGVSGTELRRQGRMHAEKYGVEFLTARVALIDQTDGDTFDLTTEKGSHVHAQRLIIATGITDNFPELPGMQPLLGKSVYLCPDCDGYEVSGRRTIVFGRGKVGVEMALTLYYWTEDLLLIDLAEDPLPHEAAAQISARGIEYVQENVINLRTSGSQIHGVVLADGQLIPTERGFLAMGGAIVRSELAAQLGVKLHANGHILMDPRSKRTSVTNVWAAGDIVAHTQQVTVAMGDGSTCAIWIQKSLLGQDIPANIPDGL
jgi:thioredoxin reductase